MKPVGYIPSIPALREELKKRDELAIEIIVGELKLREAELSGAQFNSEKYLCFTKWFQFVSRQVQHCHNLFVGKKLKRSGSIHGVTFVGKLSFMKESLIA